MNDIHVIAVCVLATTVLTGFAAVIGCCFGCVRTLNALCSV
uniref:p6 n=1 Tax=Barley yellow dwarf virus (isolate PAV) TaxID=2169986 RepID=B0FKW9_BYDVP|nr:P6 [Barley yellow dwarf virus PAV]